MDATQLRALIAKLSHALERPLDELPDASLAALVQLARQRLREAPLALLDEVCIQLQLPTTQGDDAHMLSARWSDVSDWPDDLDDLDANLDDLGASLPSMSAQHAAAGAGAPEPSSASDESRRRLARHAARLERLRARASGAAAAPPPKWVRRGEDGGAHERTTIEGAASFDGIGGSEGVHRMHAAAKLPTMSRSDSAAPARPARCAATTTAVVHDARGARTASGVGQRTAAHASNQRRTGWGSGASGAGAVDLFAGLERNVDGTPGSLETVAAAQPNNGPTFELSGLSAEQLQGLLTKLRGSHGASALLVAP
jgi:hypothetical protein